MGVALGRTRNVVHCIKFLRGDSFIVRASCSVHPDKRVLSISVMDPVCKGGGGGTIDLYPNPAPAGVRGSGCKLLHRGLGKRTSQRVFFPLYIYMYHCLCLQYHKIKPIT